VDDAALDVVAAALVGVAGAELVPGAVVDRVARPDVVVQAASPATAAASPATLMTSRRPGRSR
jgi:hypothetical protein